MNLRMSAEDKVRLDADVQQQNWELFVKDKENGRIPRQEMGQEDFLQLLTKQLAYQDPMAPMENTEFVAQMAQFSSLRYMNDMSEGFAKLSANFSRIADILSGSEAASSLGKPVELIDKGNTVRGTVQAVTRGKTPQIMVDGAYYDWNQVIQVLENRAEPAREF